MEAMQRRAAVGLDADAAPLDRVSTAIAHGIARKSLSSEVRALFDHLRRLLLVISIEPDASANTQLRSHFLGALLQIGADQGHEHGTEGKGPCPRLLGQSTQVAAGAIDE
jgi:hypothetical protein